MLPTSGPLTWAMINTELGRSPTDSSRSHLNDPAVRALAERPHGTIAYSDLHGKSAILLKTTITIAETYSFWTRRGGGAKNYGGKAYGYTRNDSGFVGNIANRRLEGRVLSGLYLEYTTYSGYSTGSRMIVDGHHAGTWWSAFTIGNTKTLRMSAGYNHNYYWGDRRVTRWEHDTDNRRDLSNYDVLGGRRSGTHTLIYE